MFLVRKYWFWLIIVFFAQIGWGQEAVNRVPVDDFSPGLFINTSLKAPIGSARSILNMDINRPQGTMGPRKGYVALTDSLAGDVDIYDIFSYYTRGHDKFLLGVDGSEGLDGLGYLKRSASHGYNLVDSLYPYIYLGEPAFFETWHGNGFISNGRQPVIMITENHVSELVIPAPGEPLIVPMASTGGPRGEYRYIIEIETQCGAEDQLGANLTTDSSFEVWTGNALDNWDFYTSASGADSAARLEPSTDYETSGTYSAVMVPDGQTENALAHVSQRVDVNTNSLYWGRCRTWFPSDFSGVWGLDAWGVNDGDSTFLGFDYYHGNQNEWITPTLYINSESYDSILIEAIYFPSEIGDSGAYFDDLTLREVGGVVSSSGYISKMVRANDEKILLTNFPFHTLTYSCDSISRGWDNISIKVYRCRAYPEFINKLDTFWLVAEFDNLYETDLDTLRFIDSLADTAFGSSITDFTLPEDDRIGREKDTTVAGDTTYTNGFRPGSPTYMGKNILDGRNCLPADSVFDSLFHVGYFVTVLDTLLGIESDSGRSLIIELHYPGDSADGSDGDSTFQIGLPPLSINNDHCVRVLWKYYTYGVLNVDSADILTVFLEDGTEVDYFNISGMLTTWPYEGTDLLLGIDTAISPVYRLATITDGDQKIFNDTIPWDTLSLRPQYWKPAAPTNANFITLHDNRVWMASGSRVYWSYLDSSNYWGKLQNVSFNVDDGTVVTGLVPMRDMMKVFKENSQYGIFKNGASYTGYWAAEGYGCIASHSIQKYGNGLIYLSRDGVVLETGSQTANRIMIPNIISKQIQPLLDVKSSVSLRNAMSTIKDGRYWLTFPGTDTTFICDLTDPAFGWTVYGYDFRTAVFYDTTHYATKTLALDLLVVMEGSDLVFKLDTLRNDSGVPYISNWESNPLILTDNIAQVDGYTLWLNSLKNEAFDIITTLIDINGDTVTVDTIKYGYDPSDSAIVADSCYRRYKNDLQINESNLFRVGLTVNMPVDSAAIDSLVFEMINLYYTRQGMDSWR